MYKERNEELNLTNISIRLIQIEIPLKRELLIFHEENFICIGTIWILLELFLFEMILQ